MKKLTSKKLIAIILAAVMVITSIPFMMVGAVASGSYKPAPYWGVDGDNDSAVNTNFMATLGSDGSVSISFPDANARKTYDGSASKYIAKYVFTLTKLASDGTRTELWSESFDATKSHTTDLGAVFTITSGAEYPNNIYYEGGALQGLHGYDVAESYDVAIQAVDNDGWVSDKIHTLLSDVPYYDISADFSPNESWVVREMLLFEGAGLAEISESSQSSGGATEPDYTKLQNAGAIDVNGQMAGMGYKSSGAYRFWIKSGYNSANGPFSMQTTWSRSHYNFTGAEEVWLYVDFSRAKINKVAFSLSSNQKTYTTWKSGEDTGESGNYGDLFSTVSVAGVNQGIVTEGLYIQNDDGLWESTSMTDGYFTDLSGYKGFIRIPIEYFILQVDQNLMHYSNSLAAVSFDGNTLDALGAWVNSVSFLDSTYDKIILKDTNGTIKGEFTGTISENISYKARNDDAWSEKSVNFINVVVNPAGTPVTKALLLQERFQKVAGNWDLSLFNTPKRSYEMGTMLCTDAPATFDASTGTYTIDYANAPKAISDMVSAGIQVADWSSDSVKKSFYLDQVMFCMKNTGAKVTTDNPNKVATDSTIKFPVESGDGFDATDVGYLVAGYYDRTKEVPKAIANYILEYFGEIPSLEDVNAKARIDEIIKTYIDCFPGCSTISEAITYLNNNHTDAYQRYKNAELFIKTYVESGNTAKNANAVKAFETGVETLPSPSYANYNDEALKTKLGTLMALYKSFNLSHFELLGIEAEAKFLELYKVMMGEEVKTGYSIGGYPYIPFNDFETNYSYGQLSHLYFDDYPTYFESMSTDVNNTKNFVTWVSAEATSHVNSISGIGRGWSPMGYNPSANDGSFEGNAYFSRMDAIIGDNGFNNSLGAKIRLHGNLNSLDGGMKLATLSTTYLGQNVNNWSELKGLDLSALAVNTAIDTNTDSTETFDQQNVTRYGSGVLPNSFVMYVDFTGVEDICMHIGFTLKRSDGTDVECYFNGGAEDKKPVIYLLDEKGEWIEEHLAVTKTDTDAASSLLNRDVASSICTISPSAENHLEGYKGFIRIPLTNFRITDLKNKVVQYTREDYIVLDDALTSHKITQAKVTFWDENGKNVDKEIDIDAMGFTYDPACQNRSTGVADCRSELNSDNGITVKNMDEYFQVKTNDSVEFEQLVTKVDPYEGKSTFNTAYKNAVAAYNELSPYQKTLKEVDTAYNKLLEKYGALAENNCANYDTLIAQEPWVAKYANAAELLTVIGTLDANSTSFDITTDANALTTPYDKTTGQIDYSKLLGTTDLTNDGVVNVDDANAIIEMYEKGYMRLSGTEKSALSADDKTKLENAYKAAKRIVLLEDYMADITEFNNKIITIYQSGTKEPDVRMVSYKNTDLQDATKIYEDMSIFAKIMQAEAHDGTGANYVNMYAAAEAIVDNSTKITPNVGDTINGGIVDFETRTNNCATDVAGKIAAKTVLDNTTLKEIEYCLGQYESFIARYAQVDELNIAYHNLADLLPTADLTSVDSSNAELTTINLSNTSAETLTYTAYIDLGYVATRLNRTVDLYAQSSLKWTQTGVSGYDAFEDLMYNNATAADLVDYQNADGVVTALVGSYTNGNTDKYQYTISVDATEAAKVPTGATYTSKVTFYAVDSNLVAEKIAEGATISDVLDNEANVLKKIEVDIVFQSTNGTDPIIYEVQIPATVQVGWDTTDTVDVSYSVEAMLGSNTLSVNISDSNSDGNNLTDLTSELTDENGNPYKLDYDDVNFGTSTFKGDVQAGTKPDNIPEIKIKQEYWDQVPVGKYSTQLTYTVDVTS